MMLCFKYNGKVHYLYSIKYLFSVCIYCSASLCKLKWMTLYHFSTEIERYDNYIDYRPSTNWSYIPKILDTIITNLANNILKFQIIHIRHCFYKGVNKNNLHFIQILQNFPFTKYNSISIHA